MRPKAGFGAQDITVQLDLAMSFSSERDVVVQDRIVRKERWDLCMSTDPCMAARFRSSGLTM